MKQELAALSLNLFQVSDQHEQALAQAVKVGQLARDLDDSSTKAKFTKETKS